MEADCKDIIMVVDDAPANLNLLRSILQPKGYQTMLFPNGKMALEAAAKRTPDLVLLDINMPLMDGFEVCQRLKADEVLKTIPVLFISAYDDISSKIKGFDAGGVDYITKPFRPEEVLARTQTHLHLRKLQYALEQSNQHLTELVNKKIREISDSQLATIAAVSKLAEYRDDETGRHIERTRTYSKILAEKLGNNPRSNELISDGFVENIYQASVLHDIGKVGIADSILLKPGKLTPEEFELMKTHTLIGAQTLQRAHAKYPGNGYLDMGIAIARSHHEKWDGSGYPDGLAGEDIPLAARIMALVDVYDALRSKRPYKPAFTHEKSCRIILEGSGTQFDPAIVSAFQTVEVEFKEINTRMNEEPQFDQGRDDFA